MEGLGRLEGLGREGAGRKPVPTPEGTYQRHIKCKGVCKGICKDTYTRCLLHLFNFYTWPVLRTAPMQCLVTLATCGPEPVHRPTHTGQGSIWM
jgi:hypothetical protein